MLPLPPFGERNGEDDPSQIKKKDGLGRGGYGVDGGFLWV